MRQAPGRTGRRRLLAPLMRHPTLRTRRRGLVVGGRALGIATGFRSGRLRARYGARVAASASDAAHIARTRGAPVRSGQQATSWWLGPLRSRARGGPLQSRGIAMPVYRLLAGHATVLELFEAPDDREAERRAHELAMEFPPRGHLPARRSDFRVERRDADTWRPVFAWEPPDGGISEAIDGSTRRAL